MAFPRGIKVVFSGEPFWRSDAREHLPALIPEAVVSVVAGTCVSAIMGFTDGADVVGLVVISAIMQVLVQGMAYSITYLTSDTEGTVKWWAKAGIAFCALYGLVVPLFLSMEPDVGALPFPGALSVTVGFMLFYLTRIQPTFVLLVVEALAMTNVVSEIVANRHEMLFVHLGCIAAIAVLFVMRSSATHLTLSEEAEPVAEEELVTEEGDAKAGRLPVLGMYGQVAALGVAVVALCLAVALAGVQVLDRAFLWGDASAGSASQTVREETSDGPSEGGDALIAEKDRATDDATDVSTADGQADASVREAPEGVGGSVPLAWLIGVPLLAALVLPVPLCLLMRRLSRRSLKQEPRPADRAARVYLGIISRLDAAGIVRAATQTPTEFISEREHELEELTAPAGIGFDEWATLTNAYEKARYADEDPTESELAVCWRIFDALPTCARAAFGWPRYLAGPFWRM